PHAQDHRPRYHAQQPDEPECGEHAPDLEAHDEEIVAFTHLVLIHRGIEIPEYREAGLEVHVHDEADARHEPQDAEQPRDAAVTPADKPESKRPQRREDQRDCYHDDWRQRTGPLPRVVIEIAQQLLPEHCQGATGIGRARKKHRVVAQATAAELLATDHRDEILPRLGIRLVEYRVQTGADIEETVDRN